MTVDDIDRAQHQEEMARTIALQAVSNRPQRDYEAELCNGCDYATKTSWGKRCDAWAECLSDLQRRERVGCPK